MTATPNDLTTALLAERVGGEVRGRGDVVITGVDTLGDAGPHDVTFITSRRRAREWADSGAAALLVAPALASDLPMRPSKCLILVPDAELALIRVLELFSEPDPTLAPGIDATAAIHPEATVEAGVSIGPYVTVASGARIGESVQLHAGVRIYGNVTVGSGSIIHANCVVRTGCTIGRDVIIHQNASIGADGFGYRLAPDGDRLLKIPHIGTVIIEDDVEIGAGTCIDRGKLGATVVGRGTKIDNLVQIAHNVRIGQGCVIAGMTGIAGSCTIGDGVQIAGGVGVADHLAIGSGAKIGAASIVLRNIPSGEVSLGYPAEPMYEKLRQWTAMRKLPALIRQFSPGRGAGRPAGGPLGGTAPDSTHASGS